MTRGALSVGGSGTVVRTEPGCSGRDEKRTRRKRRFGLKWLRARARLGGRNVQAEVGAGAGEVSGLSGVYV